MDFAADAVAEFVALPQQAASAPQSKPDGPAFEQHLRKAASSAAKSAASGLRQAADNTNETPAALVIALVQHVAPQQPGLGHAHGRDAAIVPQPEQAPAMRATAPASPVAFAAVTPPVIASAPAMAPTPPQAEAAAAEIAPTSASAVGASTAAPAGSITAPTQPQAATRDACASSVFDSAAAGANAPQITARAEAAVQPVAPPAGGVTQPPSIAAPAPAKPVGAEASLPNPAAAIAAPMTVPRQSLVSGRYHAHDGSVERLPPAAARQNAATAKPAAATVMTAAAWSPAETSQPAAPASGDITSASMAAQAATPAAAAAQTLAPQEHAARAAPVAMQVAREIVRRFGGESTQFDLRLDPPELGRVDVRLDVSRDHRVTAVVLADNPQALGELARHARELEQTLQSAGLELSENGLSFDLRHGGETAVDAEIAAAEGQHADAAEALTGDAAARARPIGLERWRGVRLDMTV